MSKALALLVGLKSVNPANYGDWDGTNGCSGCELDVDSMEAILRPLGYTVTTLKTAQATADNILQNLKNGLSQLEKGDILVFFFAGHGGQQPDRTGEELDGKDETEFYSKFAEVVTRFTEQVRELGPQKKYIGGDGE